MKKSFKAISIILCLIIALSSFCACTKKEENNSDSSQPDPSATTIDSLSADEQTTAAQAENTVSTQNEQTTLSEQTGEENQAETTVAATETNAELTVAQIVDIYNTSVNKVKPEAKKIIRHYEHQSSDEKYFEMPSAIQGVAKTAMGMFIKDNDEEQVWTSKEDFKIGFPVGGEDYSSHLTPDMVKKATCKDTGKTYKIDIVLYDDAITSPAKGKGYAGVFTTVSADTIKSVNVPGVTFERVDVNGIGGRITCTVDKATMRVTEIVFKNTDVLSMSVKVFGKMFDAKFAFACERSYSVKY